MMNNNMTMTERNNNLSNRFIACMAVILVLTVVFFESAQQFFYINIYQLSENATFTGIFLSQTRKWLIWVIFAIPLWYYIKKLADEECFTAKHVYQTVLLILGLLFLVIFSMSVVEILWAKVEFTVASLWSEYFTFYTFQKTPIYSFGYTFLALIFYFYHKNNQLTVQVLKLNQLNQNDLSHFYKNKPSQDQNSSVLKIKVGNNYKIISIDDIDWIEADDYCVNIHCRDQGAVYSMRTSLKALENILPPSFLRVHRSAIVNMEGVKEYKTKGSGLIKMKTGDEIAVAQSKLKTLNDFYTNEGSFFHH